MRRGGSCRSRATEQPGRERQTHKTAWPGREWPQGSGQGKPVRGIPHPTAYQLLALRGPLLTNNLHPQGARGQWPVAVLRTL